MDEEEPELRQEVAAALAEVEEQLSLATGRADRVEEVCRRLLRSLARGPDPGADVLERLAAQVGRRAGPAADALADMLIGLLRGSPDHLRLAPALLAAHDRVRRRAVLEAVVAHAESGCPPAPPTLERLAAQLLRCPADVGEPALLCRFRSCFAAEGADADPLLQVWAGAGSLSVRRLAALVLDVECPSASLDHAAELLDTATLDFLRPYLEFTNAGHVDLLRIREGLPTESLRRAEERIGSRLLATLLGELGWGRAEDGLSVESLVGISFGESSPLTTPRELAPFLCSLPDARVTRETTLAIACGSGDEVGGTERTDANGRESAVRIFRRYNVAHAEVLGDLLEFAPLDEVRLRRIVDRLGAIVADHVRLFAGRTAEVDRLPGVWARLRSALESVDPVDATPLVLAFEDPRSLDDVHTLHGLKRYLHQSGLTLARDRFRSSGLANRTVHLVVAGPDRKPRRVRAVRYLDFEAEPREGPLPFPVELAVRELSRPVLEGADGLPDIEMLCYGNEIQVFVFFRNHPAFLRIDLSPPLRGGMIDLEWYGASRYELDHHPDPALSVLRHFLGSLEFDVTEDAGRLHVRYDKEQTTELEQIQRKAQLVFRCLPFLMDLEWIVAGLDYPPETRLAIVAAWAGHLERWGTLPLDRVLTADRRKILVGREPGPTGSRDIAWDGAGPYRDQLLRGPATLREGIAHALSARGLDDVLDATGVAAGPLGQIELERTLIEPLQGAIRRGEVVLEGGLPGKTPPDRWRREHETQRLARVLATGGDPLVRAARVGRIVASLERHLRFRTTGDLEGHVVQRAELTLRGPAVTLFVLRDADGMIRLAIASPDPVLYRLPVPSDDAWRDGPGLDAPGLARRARSSNYPVDEAAAVPDPGEVEALRALFRDPDPRSPARLFPGDRTLSGVPASPGRATGLVRFEAAGADPEWFADSIFVSATVRPEDAPLLGQVAGIVSTGGGVLSHAGLIALELGRPALVVPGRWILLPDGARALAYRYATYREVRETVAGYRTSRREGEQVREELLREGDVAVVDADLGTLSILGHDPEALSLHRELRRAEEASAQLAGREDTDEAPVHRGRLLRATHQLEKMLARIHDAGLARHAVTELLRVPERAPTGILPDRRRLLAALFSSPKCGNVARELARDGIVDLGIRLEAAVRDGTRTVAAATNLQEILWVRAGVQRLAGLLAETAALVGAPDPESTIPGTGELDRAITIRLREMRSVLRECLESARDDALLDSRSRTRLQARSECLSALDALLPGEPPAGEDRRIVTLRRRLADLDAHSLAEASRQRVIRSGVAGRELAPLIGRKAASLGDVERILGPELVPPWFAITDRVAHEMLDGPAESAAARVGFPITSGATLRQAIDETLARSGLGPSAESEAIRRLWQATRTPPAVVAEITGAYRELGRPQDEAPGRPFVAIRSSGHEEDAEEESWAGQFETILFVRGEQAVVEHTKAALAGYWSERAIRRRGRSPTRPPRLGGGILVQRMVDPRVAGVLHSACASTGRVREMVIDACLGLGEGAVSGTVEVDQVLVSKEGDPFTEPLRFRYRVGDKRERIVFDRRVGLGTARAETLYHQRFRPALEYADLVELVRAAARLETACGHPIDVEFAFEGSRLFILQVRPIGPFRTVLEHAIRESRPPRAEPVSAIQETHP